MNHVKTIKIAAASALLAMLVACGGGGSGSLGEAAAPELKFNNAAWSSPGVFVPAEQASTKLALGRCLRDRNPEMPLFNAHLVIASNGDMSITAAVTEGGDVGTVFALPFESKLTAWGVSGTAQSPTFYILGIQAEGNESPSKLLLASMGDGLNNTLPEQGEIQAKLIVLENTGESNTSIQCESVETPVMHAKLGNARVAQHFGTAAGVTDFDDRAADSGGIVDGKAYWESAGAFGPSSAEFYFLRFDMATGELANNASGEEGGAYTPISMNLPQANADNTVTGIYGEMSCRNTLVFGPLAKYVVLAFNDSAPDGKTFNISAFSYGNVLAPNRSFMDCFKVPNPE